MSDREKLIALLKSNRNILRSAGISATATLRLVDHLIDNGVTVQEWISVKDRLPTEDEDSNHRIVGVVNGYNGKTRFIDAEIFVRYCHTENAWWSDDYDIEGCTVERFYVVPQPPKGEW